MILHHFVSAGNLQFFALPDKTASEYYDLGTGQPGLWSYFGRRLRLRISDQSNRGESKRTESPRSFRDTCCAHWHADF